MYIIFRFSYICLLIGLLASLTISSAEVPNAQEISILDAIKAAETADVSGEESFEEVSTSERKERGCIDCVYGYDLFRSTPTTFALSSDVPVPPSYTLGPGDKIRIEYYGNENLTKEGFITRTGTLHLPLLGPITLAGLTFSEAESLVAKKVSTELIGTNTFMTLSELRSINIYVLGAAFEPGTYTISALSTLTNALFASGGVNEVGSVRNIQVKRNGKVIKTFDLYDLLLKGDTSNDTRLQQGDTIFIPLIKQTVSVVGKVLRPGVFEIHKGENLKDVFTFSGEINPRSNIELSRVDYKTMQRKVSIFSLENKEMLNMEIQGGDSINIVENISLEAKNVFLSGEFHFPGYYSINSGDTLNDLISRAGGYTKEAYSQAAIFTRLSISQVQKKAYLKTAETLEKAVVDAISRGTEIDGVAYSGILAFIEKLKEVEPIGRQVIEADPLTLKTDPRLNLTLQDGDTLFVPKRPSSITVVGEVLNSASHIYKDSLTIEDYLQLSGGLTEGADRERIFVILPNGQSFLLKQKLFSRNHSESLLTGSVIVVSRNPDPFDWFKITGLITPILSDLAVSAAAIAAISNDN